MNMKRFFASIGNALKALRNGEFLLRIRADKFYMHIMYLFLLMWVTILLSLQVDKTLTQVGDNKAVIEQLRIHHAEKEAALVKLRSASATEIRLKQLGSQAAMPTEPPVVIKKKK